MSEAPRYARVCVDVAPAHLDHPFDYLIPEGVTVGAGQRVRVRFAGRARTGWVLDVAEEPATDLAKVRPLDRVDGDFTWFDPADLHLYRWVADRYAGTLADVLRHALPLRVAAVEAEAARWPAAPSPPSGSPIRTEGGSWWVRTVAGDDGSAVVGKLVAECLAAGRSALVLAPDPASPLPDAALRVAGEAGVDLRGLADQPRVRYRAFLRGRLGHARVAVGERAAVFAPLRDLGLVVVDDEANPAYKERRSPRHHAREVALARARMAGATCVLLGDLPSAHLWRLLQQGHVSEAGPDRAAQRASAPRVEVVDLSDPRPGARRARFSQRAAGAISDVVHGGGAAVVLAVRRGEGTALACRRCRARRECPVCAAAVHRNRELWGCATCGWAGPAFACRHCGAQEVSPLAAGAGRLAQELARSHPDAEVVRMEGFDAPGPASRPAIGVMTRGSVVAKPAWLRDEPAGVVVLPDADALLNRPALDGAEDALRLWFAVARWTAADSGASSGATARLVVLQTREPRHPAVQALVRWDPHGFWRREAERRKPLRYPPVAAQVALTARDDAATVAEELRAALPGGDQVLGPDLGGGLLVSSAHLRGTLDALVGLRHAWSKAGRRVRVDVDPLS